MTTKQITTTCKFCGAEQHITVPAQEYDLWAEGQGLIQNMMPGLSDDEREALLNGTCADCWEEMFGDLDDE